VDGERRVAERERAARGGRNEAARPGLATVVRGREPRDRPPRPNQERRDEREGLRRRRVVADDDVLLERRGRGLALRVVHEGPGSLALAATARKIPTSTATASVATLKRFSTTIRTPLPCCRVEQRRRRLQPKPLATGAKSSVARDPTRAEARVQPGGSISEV